MSIAGGATECARYAGNLKFIAHAKRRIGEIRSEIPGLVGLAEHSRFQNNKADWGPALTPKLGGHQFMTTIPDAATEDPMPKLTTRITGQQFRVPAGTQFRKAPTFGTAPYYTSPSAMSVQPFGVVNGDAYKTSATETDRDWYVYVASDLSYGYVPAVNGELVAIASDTTALDNKIARATDATKAAGRAVTAAINVLEE